MSAETHKGQVPVTIYVNLLWVVPASERDAIQSQRCLMEIRNAKSSGHTNSQAPTLDTERETSRSSSECWSPAVSPHI